MTRRRDRFEVEWTSPARRAIARLPEKVAVAAIEFIYGPLTDNPQLVGHPLQFELTGEHSAHLGDYRIIYRLDTQSRTVSILAIDHRAELYRPR